MYDFHSPAKEPVVQSKVWDWDGSTMQKVQDLLGAERLYRGSMA